jgi:hypothetical protein
MKTLRQILREKGIVKTDDFHSPGVKVAKKPSEDGALARAETPKPWNSRRAFRVHPYFSNNLRYAC